jgi:hypothetical protein
LKSEAVRGFSGDRKAGLGIGAELAVPGWLGEELLGPLESQLVGGELLGNARPLPVPLEVRPVAADPEDDPLADFEGVDLARVDRAQIRDELLQPGAAGSAVGRAAGTRLEDRAAFGGARAVAEVEAAQPLDAVLVPGRDPVEVVLHPGGEVVVDEPAEVLLEQVDDREGEEGRDERRAPLEDVAAVEDRAEDRGVRGRAADAELLERPHEGRLGVAGGRARLVALRLERAQLYRVALGEVRQAPLLVVLLRGAVDVASLLVCGEEAAERDHGAGGAKLD